MDQPIHRRAALALALAAASAPVLAQSRKPAPASATAANWPTRPLRILVGFPGGSTPDLVARTIAEPLSKALGQPVVVDNRPGAGGNIAADAVVRATDDHTIGVMINGNMTIAKLLNPATPFDPLKDLAPVSLIGTAPLLLTAPANAPGHNAQEFFVAARNAGNKWSYGTPGVGTVGHIGMELIKTRTNIDPVHVPYPGNPQVINAMIAGQVHLALLPPGLAAPQIRAGKLRAIGVTSPGRSPLVPEYPSLDEGGVTRGLQLEIWTAAAAPASMPKPIVAKLSSLIAEIARMPDVRQKLFQQGWQVAGTSSEGLANRIKADTALLGGVIQMRGIKAE
ncbi:MULTISPECIES: Bug family tripartite tricarboxylate transporter substrate binding protein [Ramlibacter]|uniref:Tripartite tricarboxylate transporter substrate binding protein n=1 Tax=Ramlibacter pinisoli TaxID=2682844 RepID=A0A6N8IT90_9BURK|nr:MULTISPECIES: tripartite tricarboxylate transporter substrate binding protein [Ramlibacter]MBA2965083.1 tripartite tricarboxylate transporter substrate binding protein [Ramlibacter sp. CGMCC 1.13660]MVQ30048.1 tripartite tricarboxylate transporter substrate binding protein [Ramlibacter pinisoli]